MFIGFFAFFCFLNFLNGVFHVFFGTSWDNIRDMVGSPRIMEDFITGNPIFQIFRGERAHFRRFRTCGIYWDPLEGCYKRRNRHEVPSGEHTNSN